MTTNEICLSTGHAWEVNQVAGWQDWPTKAFVCQRCDGVMSLVDAAKSLSTVRRRDRELAEARRQLAEAETARGYDRQGYCDFEEANYALESDLREAAEAVRLLLAWARPADKALTRPGHFQYPTKQWRDLPAWMRKEIGK